jgi:quercetin dioxygenase-like cupin family protein
MSATTRRIVTGHAADGRSVVLSDAPVPHVRDVPAACFDEVWATGAAPEMLAAEPAGEPTGPGSRIGAAPGGSVIRVIEFDGSGGPSPMHRTRTLDYGIVLEGEVVLILSDSEVTLGPGDVVIQRGTDHAWDNRSGKPAKMAFVLIDAAFGKELAALIGEAEITP